MSNQNLKGLYSVGEFKMKLLFSSGESESLTSSENEFENRGLKKIGIKLREATLLQIYVERNELKLRKVDKKNARYDVSRLIEVKLI